MEHKRLTIFAGHYGSGKTNIAVNYALHLAKLGKKVCIADLDIVNPYFRTKDSEKLLTENGIDLISQKFANSNVDLPALPAESYRIVEDFSSFAVADVGGDDRGAYALGRFTPEILKENNYRFVFVANCYRPLTKTPEEAVEIMREIEAACGIKFDCIVNNSNLGCETTTQTVLASVPYAEALSALTGLPIWFHSVEEKVAKNLTDLKVFPLTLQEKPF